MQRVCKVVGRVARTLARVGGERNVSGAVLGGWWPFLLGAPSSYHIAQFSCRHLALGCFR